MALPSSEGSSHRFTETLPREEARLGHCDECATTLEAWEGQNGARAYSFNARLIAHGLKLIAQGMSCRRAAYECRRQAERLRAHNPRGGIYPSRKRDPNLDGQPMANWVDVYTELVAWDDLPAQWPQRIAVDSANFQVARKSIGPRGGTRFNVLIAAGYNEGSETGRTWRLEPSPQQAIADWVRFFEQLDGTPEVIVADMDQSIQKAAQRVFPRPGDAAPAFHLCEDHLNRNLLTFLQPIVRHSPHHPVLKRLRGAFSTLQGWREFKLEAEAANQMWSINRAMGFIRKHGRMIERQIHTRHIEGPARSALQRPNWAWSRTPSPIATPQ